VYRPFNPRNNVHPRVFFENQLKIIKTACTNNTLLLGDFNLDWCKKELRQYAFRAYFDDMERVLSGSDLVQMVNFPTWSRTINGVVKESLLDHLYSNNPLSISDIHSVEPIFGDHYMIVASMCTVKPQPSFCYRRNWSSYNTTTLCENLALVD
jgi:endonuclease/exonuclease/phosphatase family metal-dependent hydrolase